MERAAEFTAARHVVLTGGEPMLAPGIAELSHRLRERGMHITVETAGTVYAPVACDLMSISPKLSNSTPEGVFRAQHERLRIQPEVLRRLIADYDYQLKFVIANEPDLAEAQELIAALNAPACKVILMPEGITAEASECPRRLDRGVVQTARVPVQPAAPRTLVREPAGHIARAGKGFQSGTLPLADARGSAEQ